MIRGNSAPRARRLRAWLFAALAALPITAVLAATQYLYDDLGRLVLAANTDGSATVYAHDENGNVVTIINWAASGPVVAGFSPMQGHAGTPVTIFGAGFSATPSENTVTIGGAAATVSSSTTTTIESSIPMSAITGPITVTVGGATAVSTSNMTVYKPLISSFSPALVAPGGTVTLTGASLNLVSGGTSLTVGGTSVTVTSLSNTQAVFTAPNTTGGPIVVNTSYGQATSATSLVIVPNAVGVANVVDHDPADPDGSAQALAINQQNKVALLSFQAATSSYYSVQLDALTLTPSGGSINYTVYGPTGASFASGSVSTTAPSIHLPQTTSAGRYLVAFNSGSKTSVAITARVELNTLVTANGTTVPSSSLGPRQSKRFIFSATNGDDLAFALTNLVITPSSPNYVSVNVLQPTNYNYWPSSENCYLTSTPGCSFNLMNLWGTGTYQLFVGSNGASTMSFGLTLSTDIAGTLTPGASPTTLDFEVPGRQALLTFTATAGDNRTLRFNSPSTTPAGVGFSYILYAPGNGGPIASNPNFTAATTVNLSSLPTTGTYTLLLAPRTAATGSVQLMFLDSTLGTLPTDGSTQTFSTTVPSQNAYFTFSATAGDDVSLAITNLVLTPNPPSGITWIVIRPDGYQLVGNTTCSASVTPGCTKDSNLNDSPLINLPLTGTYKVIVSPQGAATMSFALTLSQDLTDALTPGTPLAISLDTPGRQGMLTFTATVGQTVALQLSSLATTPAGKAVGFRVYRANGDVIANASNVTTPTTFNLNDLTAGTYSVFLAPRDAAMGSAQLTLVNGVTATLPTDGSTQTFSTTLPSQNAYFTFSGTAGDDVSLAITNLALTPNPPSGISWIVIRPDGYQLVGNTNCSASVTPGCTKDSNLNDSPLLNLPLTGTYKVIVSPQGAATMSFNLTLSQDLATALTAGTPLNVNFDAPGRQGFLPFTVTAGQTVALHLGSLAMTPAGKAVGFRVYRSNGEIIANVSVTTSATFNLTNLTAGTYSVFLAPRDAAMGTAQLTLVNAVGGALSGGGATQSFATTVPQQHANFHVLGDGRRRPRIRDHESRPDAEHAELRAPVGEPTG